MPTSRRPNGLRVLIVALAGMMLMPGGARAAALDGPQLAGLMDRIGRSSERRAAFRDDKVIGGLRQTLTSTGYLVYRRPSYFEKVTITPRRERVVVSRDDVTIEAEGRSPQVISLASQPGLEALIDAFRGALSGDLPMLQRAYTVEAESEGGAWRLTLSPRDGAVARFVRRVVIEGRGGAPGSIDISQPNGDRERLTLSSR